MSDFLLAFVGGLASGVVLTILTALIRRLLRRRAKSESVALNWKELRPLVVIVVGFALIFIDIFLVTRRAESHGLCPWVNEKAAV